jgi:Fe2+ or Zn2+ uptake regulation protein
MELAGTGPPDGVDTSAADEGPLITLFSGPARVKIIEAFVAERGRDLSISDIARLSDTARSTVYRHIEDLEALGIVKHVRYTNDGHSARYQLNEDNDIAHLLYQLEGTTLRRLLELDSNLEE